MNISSLTDQNFLAPFRKLERVRDEKTQETVSRVFSRRAPIEWTSEEEQILKEAVARCKKENPLAFTYSGPSETSRCSIFFAISRYPEVKQFGRDTKQLREKWIRDLCPNSLGGSIQENHREIIEGLYKKNSNKWVAISKAFAEMDLPDKPLGKYYSDNAIKNYCYSKHWHSRSSSETTSEDILRKRKRSQDKVGRVFSHKLPRGWTSDEEQILKNAIEKYKKKDSCVLPYTGLKRESQYHKMFSVISKYSEVDTLDRTARQLRNKWIRDLCPNSLGGVIQEDHKEIIEGLYKKSPNKWVVILKEFAEMDLPDKPSGKYYCDNTIKNYFYNKSRKIQRKLARDSELEPSKGKEADSEILDEGIDILLEDLFDGQEGPFSYDSNPAVSDFL